LSRVIQVSRARVIGLVVKKEVLDMVRDRRTIITALVIPLVSFPILFGVVGYFANPTSNPSPVLVVNNDNGSYSSVLTGALLRTPGLSLTSSGVSNLTEAVQTGKYDAALEIPGNFSSTIAGGSQANITIYFNPSNSRAVQGVSIIRGELTALSQQISSTRLSGKGVTRAELYPIGLNSTPVGRVTNQSLVFAANLFPSFLLYFTFLGAFYFMVDDIAGEKERRSLEALFTLPPSRTTIFLGKYTVAFLLSMLTALLGLAGTLIGLDELGSQTISIPIQLFPAIFGVVALAGLSLSALGFCISTFAKNIREAQQYLSPLFLLFFIPLYFVSFLPPGQVSQYAAIPLMGYTVLLRDVIIGSAGLGEVLISAIVNIATLLFLVWLGIRLLGSEKVILRSA
jgi:ABC-type Na+ efflux pump permease subunit